MINIFNNKEGNEFIDSNKEKLFFMSIIFKWCLPLQVIIIILENNNDKIKNKAYEVFNLTYLNEFNINNGFIKEEDIIKFVSFKVISLFLYLLIAIIVVDGLPISILVTNKDGEFIDSNIEKRLKIL